MSKAYYWYRPHPYFSEFYSGKVLNLLPCTITFTKYLTSMAKIELAEKYFPNGMNPHGFQTLLNHKVSDENFSEPIVEIIFELVRQLHFPDAPSRLTSLYASNSIEEAEKWQELWNKNFGHTHGQIAQSLWEIEYQTTSMLYDANFLEIMPNDEFSYLTALENAHKYWNGNLSSCPLPELLIPYPVTVVSLVRNHNFTTKC